ncbi:MAG: hypothetical protein ACO1NX_03290 [Chitinophagaceae bacterium]
MLVIKGYTIRALWVTAPVGCLNVGQRRLFQEGKITGFRLKTGLGTLNSNKILMAANALRQALLPLRNAFAACRL